MTVMRESVKIYVQRLCEILNEVPLAKFHPLSTLCMSYSCMYYANQCGWYWGAMSFDEAEAMLANRRDGSFLVRDSSDERYILSLSFRSLGGTHHTRIEHYKGNVDSISGR